MYIYFSDISIDDTPNSMYSRLCRGERGCVLRYSPISEYTGIFADRACQSSIAGYIERDIHIKCIYRLYLYLAFIFRSCETPSLLSIANERITLKDLNTIFLAWKAYHVESHTDLQWQRHSHNYTRVQYLSYRQWHSYSMGNIIHIY